MSVPDRSALVRWVCDNAPDVFWKPDAISTEQWNREMDERRLRFLPTIIRALNLATADTRRMYRYLRTNIHALESGDNPDLAAALPAPDTGRWGVLRKTDQGNKIPCDVAVYDDGASLTTVDVMTGTGALWNVQGLVTNPAWHFVALAPDGSIPPAEAPTPPPPPPPPPSSPVEYVMILELLRELRLLMAALESRVARDDDSNERRFQALARGYENLSLQIGHLVPPTYTGSVRLPIVGTVTFTLTPRP